MASNCLCLCVQQEDATCQHHWIFLPKELKNSSSSHLHGTLYCCYTLLLTRSFTWKQVIEQVSSVRLLKNNVNLEPFVLYSQLRARVMKNNEYVQALKYPN